jgi:hypothetical protein
MLPNQHKDHVTLSLVPGGAMRRIERDMQGQHIRRFGIGWRFVGTTVEQDLLETADLDARDGLPAFFIFAAREWFVTCAPQEAECIVIPMS